MAYWRMQLHPANPGESTKDCGESLAAGFVGLDFTVDVGNLMAVNMAALPQAEKDYCLFAREMAVDDIVLIVAHHFPFALATIAGEYNYILQPVPEIGVWFRHFRKIREVHYYADFVTNAHKWEKLTMTDAIAPLRDPQSISYRLIEDWRRRIGRAAAG